MNSRMLGWAAAHMINTCQHSKLTVKVKKSHYRPGQSLRIPGSWGSQISSQSAHEIVRLPALRTDHLYHQEIFLVLISVRGRINSKVFKVYTKVKLRFFFEFWFKISRYIVNKSKIKITLSWDKSNFSFSLTQVPGSWNNITQRMQAV